MKLLRLCACLALLAMLCAIAAVSLAADTFGVYTLVPSICPSSEGDGSADLYFGPTQGYLHEDGLTLDLTGPYVFFGQVDCWAMVAAGTPERFGPVGWVEAAAANFPEAPLLSFDDALPVMVEEDTFLTADPLSDSPASLCDVARGTQVLLLAHLGDWGYVQAEADGTPVRAFLPLSAIL